MNDSNPKPAKLGARAEREKRLAEALRANLRRRKSAAAEKAASYSSDTAAAASDEGVDSGESRE